MNNNPHLNAIRMLGIEAINEAQSGHPGIVLGASPVVYTLFTSILHLTPNHPDWINRDRFILSAGHGSAMLYAALHLAGYPISIEDLRQFRQLNSPTPGHPERNVAHGIEVTTGPLGQGLAMGVGLAVAEEYLAAQYNKPYFPIINHFTYVLCSDGDLQEGVAQEAISFAGKQKLKKLIVLHDSNDVQLDSNVNQINSENLHERFRASGWKTLKIEDGEDDLAIQHAIHKAQKHGVPTYIEVKTIIGRGSSQQGTSAVHGAPLIDLADTRQAYHWAQKPFAIPRETYEFYERNVRQRGNRHYEAWTKMFASYKLQYPDDYRDLQRAIDQEWNLDYKALNELNPHKTVATRVSSGIIVDYLMKHNRNFIGGSADLASSTKVQGTGGDFSPENRKGQNILYGVREFAMGAINNGIAAHGALLPIGATFLVFSDYMKPAIRLAALMELQNLFVFSHDSIAVGEDGPTHQPIEQLTMLRTIPNLNVFRPADFAEALVAYEYALRDKRQPTAIVTTRQEVMPQNHNNIQSDVRHGGYILSDHPHPEVTLIASGSEVQLAMETKKCLARDHIASRVVSLPSPYLFDKQDQKYRHKVIDPKTRRFAMEMGVPDTLYKYVGDDGAVFGISSFGHAGKGTEVVKYFGFTPEKICHKIEMKLKEKTNESIG